MFFGYDNLTRETIVFADSDFQQNIIFLFWPVQIHN